MASTAHFCRSWGKAARKAANRLRLVMAVKKKEESAESREISGTFMVGRRLRHGQLAQDALAVRVQRGRLPAHQRSEEHTSELQSPCNLVCRLLLEKKKST